MLTKEHSSHMADDIEAHEDAVKHRLVLRGFTTEQAQELAQMQVQRVVVLTGNFFTTIITVITSAFGLVTALAWNKFIGDWLPTVNLFGVGDHLGKELVYALTVTIMTVLAIGILAVTRERRDKQREAREK
jgi:predicted DNA repair protein MutK